MQIAVLTDEHLKAEFIEKKLPHEVNMIWVNTLEQLVNCSADVYMDLLFNKDIQRITLLAKLLNKPVL